MRRLIVLAVFLAACGGTAQVASTTGGDPTASTSTEPTQSATTDTTTIDSGTTDSGTTDTTIATPPADCPVPTDTDRPDAPDFTLALGDGGEYTLSDGCRPVYLVFWAEW